MYSRRNSVGHALKLAIIDESMTGGKLPKVLIAQLRVGLAVTNHDYAGALSADVANLVHVPLYISFCLRVK